MADVWYLGRDGREFGPYSIEHIKKLAALGRLQSTDLVRKEDMAAGVPALRVKGLFEGAPVWAGGGETVAAEAPATQAGDVGTLPAVEESEEPAEETDLGATRPLSQPAYEKLAPPSRPKEPVKKRRAVAISGAVILSQDGTSVKFRKVCSKCGHEDSVRSTMLIGIGFMRFKFFCQKCRKQRDVQLQGVG